MKAAPVVVVILIGAGISGVYSFLAARNADQGLEVMSTPSKVIKEAPAMCPWRSPDADRLSFFPQSDGYRTDTLILSSLRTEVSKRLGKGSGPDANALYVYRILQESAVCGTVLVRRTAALHGSIELVVGLNPAGEIVGVHIQRQREPEQAARIIRNPAWLRAFRGKTDRSDFGVGTGLPEVATAAKETAVSVANAVRMLLIEYSVAEAGLKPIRK